MLRVTFLDGLVAEYAADGAVQAGAMSPLLMLCAAGPPPTIVAYLPIGVVREIAVLTAPAVPAVPAAWDGPGEI
jgi:hypothetical protein